MSDSDEELSFASVDDADEEKISGTIIGYSYSATTLL